MTSLRDRAIAAIHRPRDIGHSLVGPYETNPAIAADIVGAVLATVRAELLGCKTCGQIHEYRRECRHVPQCSESEGRCVLWTWADPIDGHSYRRRGLAELEAAVAPVPDQPEERAP